MARFYFIILLFLVAGCAQVSPLSGGEKDLYAPKPIEEKVKPKNGSLFFSGNSVFIPFNEFIRLKQPQKNIRMIPPHATVKAQVKGKNLLLSWDETLKKNTTYVIYLNGAIQDMTEKNDSLMKYVFSTGGIIDSLTYEVRVVDALTAKPVKECLLTLRDTNNHLVSFTETNTQGWAKLQYLKPGNYQLLAFIDENRDFLWQENERIGFQINSVLPLKESKKDSVPIRLFKPKLKAHLTTVKYLPYGQMLVAGNRSLQNATFLIDEEKQNKIQFLSEDSLKIFFDSREKQKITLITVHSEFKDTSIVRISLKQKKNPITISCKNKCHFLPQENIYMQVNDWITEVDSSLIDIIRTKDSLSCSFSIDSIIQNKIYFTVQEDGNNFTFLFHPNAIKTVHSSSPQTSLDVLYSNENDFGSLSIDLSAYHNPIVFWLFRGKEKVREIPLTKGEKITLNYLLPGKYFAGVVMDENKNGKWDTGDFKKKQQPEKIDYFLKPVEVRAGWEIDIQYQPSER